MIRKRLSRCQWTVYVELACVGVAFFFVTKSAGIDSSVIRCVHTATGLGKSVYSYKVPSHLKPNAMGVR
jgi:hypothetical protein